ncbi:MAG: hypothetical protein ACK2T6_07280 [Anaerolineae bacterium]
METIDVVAVLSGKWEDGTRPADLYDQHVATDPEAYLPRILDGLRSSSGKPQSGCAELASRLSEARPDLLWPERELFVANLSAEPPVVRWEAACVLGNLAAVDTGGELRRQVPELEALLTADSIVLQGHAVRALAKMARAYPSEAEGILDSLISAEDRFPGSRVGFLVESMADFAAYPELRPTARAFAERHRVSDVKAVARKARRAVKALE